MTTIHEVYSNFNNLNRFVSEKFESHLNKRFCSIGRGRRFENYDDLSSPGPGRYSPNYKERLKSVKFGSSPRSTFSISEDSPGPGAYNYSKMPKGGFTFSKKLEPIIPQLPGPGDYEINSFARNLKNIKFGSDVRKDIFLDPQFSKNPEPWKYNNYKSFSSPKWKFGSEPRVKDVDLSRLGVFEALLKNKLLK